MTDLFQEEPTAPSFEDLVGEGKKYKDQSAVAKAIFEKDSFIERLQKENAEARAELQARLNLEELADQVIQKTKAKPQDALPNNHRQDPPLEQKPETEKPEINLQEEVQRLLKEERTRENRKGNLDKSIEGLKELYGADYQASLNRVATDLGVSKEYLTDLASTSPAGFLKVVQSVVPKDDNRPVTPPAASGGGQFTPPASTKKNQTYFNELRRSDPKTYFSKKVQQEMVKAARELGDAFYS